MKASYIDYKDTGNFSHTLLSYIDRDPQLADLISEWPDIAAFGRQIDRKSNAPAALDRDVLVRVLLSQYKSIPTFESEGSNLVRSNIIALGDQKTFTVTTGHQLNVFTGPLYFIYKIASTVRLAKDLKKAYPDKEFIPVFWMATEDHDFEEINHTWVHGKKISWDVPAVSGTGRMLTDHIGALISEYQSLLGLSMNANELSELAETAYLGQANLADATRHLVHVLFKKYGLVIVDADDVELKRAFAPIITEDIIGQHSHQAIASNNEKLTSRGFAVQVSDRPINFFYLTDEFRERIVFEDGYYHVNRQDIRFTEQELRDEIASNPERFSPNAVMRPMYQEVILPNLAYIGGGAEVVYWLQLNEAFKYYSVPYPLLILRNSGMLADSRISEKLNRLNLDFKDIFKPTLQLKNEYVHAQSNHQLDLHTEWEELSTVFEKIKARATKIDPTLGPSTEAIHARLKHAINRLEKKLLKADKRNHQDALAQIDRIKEKLFPNGGLQERTENFTVPYIKHGPELVDELIRLFDPLEFKFTVLH